MLPANPVPPPEPSNRAVAFFHRAIVPRTSGLFLLGFTILILWSAFDTRRVSIKELALVAFCGAPGSWLLVFGYPIDTKNGTPDAKPGTPEFRFSLGQSKGHEPMAPRWWRLGLIAWILIWLAVESAFFSR